MVTCDQPAAVRGRLRQERADPAVRLAARRHGRPDPGVRADPRGHHGHRRRLHDRPRSSRSSTPSRGAPMVVVDVARSPRSSRRPSLPRTTSRRCSPTPRSSQLGYMFLALGAGGLLWPAIVHLFDPRFLQGLPVPRPGSVIHAWTSEQDMRRMGGLRKRLPHHLRDVRSAPGDRRPAAVRRVLLQGRHPRAAPSRGRLDGRLVWRPGTGARVTAFYMSRLMLLTFWRPEPRRRQVQHAPRVSRRHDRSARHPRRAGGRAGLVAGLPPAAAGVDAGCARCSSTSRAAPPHGLAGSGGRRSCCCRSSSCCSASAPPGMAYLRRPCSCRHGPPRACPGLPGVAAQVLHGRDLRRRRRAPGDGLRRLAVAPSSTRR